MKKCPLDERPTDIPFHLKLLFVCAETGKRREAETILTNVCKSPGASEYHFNVLFAKAVLSIYDGHYELASQLYKECQTKMPLQNPITSNNWAVCQLFMNKPGRAVELLEQSVSTCCAPQTRSEISTITEPSYHNLKNLYEINYYRSDRNKTQIVK